MTLSVFRLPITLACGAIIFTACAKLPRRTITSSDLQSNLITQQDSIRININTAPTSELEKLPGIGSALAERIVAHREQYGPFRRAEHLMMVRGISERKFRKLRPLVKLE